MKNFVALITAGMASVLFLTAAAAPVETTAETKPAVAVKSVAETTSEKKIWLPTMDQALAQAGKSGKDILVYFSGSDWSDWCTKLETEVLKTEEFLKSIPENFEMVQLDFPKNAKLPPLQESHNKTWQKKLGVKIFPLIVLTDAKGAPYGQIGYLKDGAEKYLTELNAVRKKGHERLALMAKAAKQSGLEKAKTLGEALDDLEDELVFAAYNMHVDSILTNDPQNKTGYPVVYKVKKVIQGMQKYMNPYIPGLPSRGRKALDKALLELKPTGKALQQLLSVKAITYLMEENRTDAKKAMEEAIVAAPDTEQAQMMKAEMDRLFGKFAMATSEVSKYAREQKWDDALKKVTAMFETFKPEGENLQQLYIMKGQILLQQKDLLGAKTAFEAGLKIDPKSNMGEYITNMLEEQLKKSIEEQLKLQQQQQQQNLSL
jgi:thioredoxin-related protein